MITVVIPALNEQNAIGHTVELIKTTLTKAKLEPFEILVIDDGSKDETAQRATTGGARVIRHPHNAGYGRSLKDGIRAARFDTIIISDADGTYPIEAMPALVERYSEGFDMVVGARSGIHYRESLLKMPLRFILRRLVEFTASRAVPDINSGLRVFSREVALSYFNHLCDTFSFTTSMTLAYMMTSRYVAYVPIEYNKRIGASKVRLMRDSLRTIQYILEAAIYYNPLKIFVLLAAIVFLGSGLCFALALLTRLNVFFFTGIGGLVGCVLIMAIGFLAVLLRQIMIQSSTGNEAFRPSERGREAIELTVGNGQLVVPLDAPLDPSFPARRPNPPCVE
jgi:glycosyltransferase involved in cell wall biosynthesis